MTYEDYFTWCEERKADGQWLPNEQSFCTVMVKELKRVWPWKRKMVWEAIRDELLTEFVNPINARIAKQKESEKTPCDS